MDSAAKSIITICVILGGITILWLFLRQGKTAAQIEKKYFLPIFKVIGVISGCGIFGLIAYCSLHKPEPVQKAEATPIKIEKSAKEIEHEREEAQQEGAKKVCKYVIESSLKAPSTAKWGELLFVQIKGDDPSLYGVLVEVDAQNSFGAMLRTKHLCKFKKVGKNYEFVDVIEQ